MRSLRRKLGRKCPGGDGIGYPREKSIDRFKRPVRDDGATDTSVDRPNHCGDESIVRGWVVSLQRFRRKLFTGSSMAPDVPIMVALM